MLRASLSRIRPHLACYGASQVSPSQQGMTFIRQYAHWPWPCTQTIFSGRPQDGHCGCKIGVALTADLLFGWFAFRWSVILPLCLTLFPKPRPYRALKTPQEMIRYNNLARKPKAGRKRGKISWGIIVETSFGIPYGIRIIFYKLLIKIIFFIGLIIYQ